MAQLLKTVYYSTVKHRIVQKSTEQHSKINAPLLTIDLLKAKRTKLKRIA